MHLFHDFQARPCYVEQWESVSVVYCPEVCSYVQHSYCLSRRMLGKLVWIRGNSQMPPTLRSQLVSNAASFPGWSRSARKTIILSNWRIRRSPCLAKNHDFEPCWETVSNRPRNRMMSIRSIYRGASDLLSRDMTRVSVLDLYEQAMSIDHLVLHAMQRKPVWDGRHLFFGLTIVSRGCDHGPWRFIEPDYHQKRDSNIPVTLWPWNVVQHSILANFRQAILSVLSQHSVVLCLPRV